VNNNNNCITTVIIASTTTHQFWNGQSEWGLWSEKLNNRGLQKQDLRIPDIDNNFTLEYYSLEEEDVYILKKQDNLIDNLQSVFTQLDIKPDKIFVHDYPLVVDTDQLNQLKEKVSCKIYPYSTQEERAPTLNDIKEIIESI